VASYQLPRSARNGVFAEQISTNGWSTTKTSQGTAERKTDFSPSKEVLILHARPFINLIFEIVAGIYVAGVLGVLLVGA
jgi:hypothetical protein